VQAVDLVLHHLGLVIGQHREMRQCPARVGVDPLRATSLLQRLSEAAQVEGEIGELVQRLWPVGSVAAGGAMVGVVHGSDPSYGSALDVAQAMVAAVAWAG
jgi:hypothetical protein